MSTPNNLQRRTEPIGVRDQADALLDRLLAERTRTERRLAEAGRTDPLKLVTGRSAIDNAIAATREMIRDVDELLGDGVGQHNGTTSSLIDSIRAGTQSVR